MVLLSVTVTDLLHAGASYLRIHQKGFGAVGVSTKYGKRAFARYPIFWGMRDVGGLPNPDPTDTGSWSGEQIKTREISIDKRLEDSRPKEKRLAQNWAGLVFPIVLLSCPNSNRRRSCKAKIPLAFFNPVSVFRFIL